MAAAADEALGGGEGGGGAPAFAQDFLDLLEWHGVLDAESCLHLLAGELWVALPDRVDADSCGGMLI